MGNRAIITTKSREIGIYLHWNGGIDSITAFLKYCELRKFRGFPDEYGIARLTQIIANYFGGDLSIGITTTPESYRCDNGIYVVEGWNIVEHLQHTPFGNDLVSYGYEQHEGYDLLEMLIDIDNSQPENDRLGENKIKAAIS